MIYELEEQLTGENNMYNEIYRAIENYYKKYNDMPNTVIIPDIAYQILLEHSRQHLISRHIEMKKHNKIFGMNIIVTANENEIKAIKIIEARLEI